MKTVFALFCFGALALAAGPSVSMSINAPAHGPVEVIVRNHGNAPVTAYAYTLRWTGGSLDRFEDSALALDRRPVFPNAAEVRRPAGAGPHATLEFHAALFADGTNFGDPAWVARLTARRRYAAAVISDSHNRLAGGIAAKASRETLAASFRSLANSRSGLADADQQEVSRQLHERIAERLGKSTPAAQLRDLELLQQKLAEAQPNLAAN